MSVLDEKIVDGIALAQDGKCLCLLITDHLDWSREYDHLISLQNKINGYISFCENRQYCEIYPDAQIECAVFEIHFLYEPTEKAWKFLEEVQKQVNEMGIRLRCQISKQ